MNLRLNEKLKTKSLELLFTLLEIRSKHVIKA